MLLMLYVLWALISAIIHMSSKKLYMGTFGLVSKIINLVVATLAFIIELIIIIDTQFTLAIFTVFMLITIADLVFTILKVVYHSKSKKQK